MICRCNIYYSLLCKQQFQRKQNPL